MDLDDADLDLLDEDEDMEPAEDKKVEEEKSNTV